MDTQPIHCLLIHGTIVLLFGLLSGLPFWITIIRKKSGDAIRGWRVAHTTLIGCGMLLILAGLANIYINLTEGLRTLLVWALVVSGYSFTFALVVGAGTGRRALLPTSNALDILLFLGHFFGAVGAFVGIGLFLYGLF